MFLHGAYQHLQEVMFVHCDKEAKNGMVHQIEMVPEPEQKTAQEGRFVEPGLAQVTKAPRVGKA